ncbi:class I SAM-dependent rRNA methyltransferase [Pedomonas mirosovicensis]|uniref:class I SAM-dependent rRNA methyltransferase n=1 Tax=Pedomonas mirosovicensis TaxID=2908641 RepID=UPI00216A3BB1|nr:class I SAM-dependent rRNA methyltransferase [Pedomonas mirosovicensis]MCH8684233.1 class I SAM-dependent rRNA methyltransferase [Pedomonas mirosovicensis]
MTSDENEPKIFLARNVKPASVRGRPWVFSNQLQFSADVRAIAPGTVVRLAEADGRLLGLYHFNPHSLIAARLLTRNHSRTIDARFYKERIEKALTLRERLFDRPFYRLVHSEGDFLPGLVIDRYGDAVVVQPNTAGMDAHKEMILEALQAVLKPKTIALVSGGAARTLEGLEPLNEVPVGAIDGPVQLEENGLTYFGDLTGGQKTGWFFDHRLNRAFVSRLARGQDVLDLYTYAGAFALAAASGGANSVTAVDRSDSALQLANKAAEANGLADKVTTVTADVFEYLQNDTRHYGVVVADPPAFAKSRKDIPSAMKGYEKLARLAVQRVAPDGLLCIASCSHHISAEAFQEATSAGIRTGGRAAKLIHAAAAGPDHPVHPLLPQTAYLKFLVYALD